MLEVRSGEPADLPAIAAIQEASPEAARWPVSDYLDHDLRVAACEGRVIGFLVSRSLGEGESEILNLAVAPEYRRQGAAKALIGSLLHGTKGYVFLEVRESNRGAIRLYEGLGFQQLALRKQYYDTPPEGCIVMKFLS